MEGEDNTKQNFFRLHEKYTRVLRSASLFTFHFKQQNMETVGVYKQPHIT